MGFDKEIKVAAPEPQVLRLADAAAYQEGSIVSKQLIKKDTGTVTLFAFAEGEGLSEHTAPFDAMVLVLDGEAEVTIAKKPYRLTSGDMIVMPAHQPHALKAVRQFKMLLVMIRS